jgi:hypothetical protein
VIQSSEPWTWGQSGEAAISESREENVEVGVLGSVERLRSEVAEEAMMRGCDWQCDVESAGQVGVSFISVHCRTFDNDLRVGKKIRKPSEEQGVRNRFVVSSPVNDLCTVFSSFNFAPEKAGRSETGRNCHPTSDGVRRQTTLAGWEVPLINGTSRFMYKALFNKKGMNDVAPEL